MKIKHKINHGWVPPAEPVDDAYQAEVDASVRRGEARWLKAVKAVDRAERRVQRIERKQSEMAETRAELDRARTELLRRYDELREIEAVMQHAPGSEPTGRGSVRNPLPKGSKL